MWRIIIIKEVMVMRLYDGNKHNNRELREGFIPSSTLLMSHRIKETKVRGPSGKITESYAWLRLSENDMCINCNLCNRSVDIIIAMQCATQ